MEDQRREAADAAAAQQAAERMKPSSSSSSRFLPLDVLRGLAILLVLGHHSVVAPDATGWLFVPFGIARRAGWAGVDLFFVLSGFLVGGLLLAEIQERGTPDVRRFFIRRLFKIWPSYYLYLAFTAMGLAARAAAGDGHTWRSGLASPASALGGVANVGMVLWPNLLHVQNYWPTRIEHAWSLAVEEHFYLVLPLLLLAICGAGKDSARFRARFLAAAGAVILVPLALRIAFCRSDPSSVYHATHFRIDSLCFGVLLAFLARFQPELIARVSRHPGRLLAVGSLCLAPAVLLKGLDPLMLSLGYTLLSLGFGCLLLWIITVRAGEGLAGRLVWGWPGRAVAWVGFYSYTIYLWHNYTVRPAFTRLLASRELGAIPPEVRAVLGTLAYVAAACLLGMVTSRLLELPMLRLRERLFPSRTTATGKLAPGEVFLVP